jgi:hypothetical protein
VDVADPANPIFKGSYETPDYAYYGVEVFGNCVYVADKDSGLQIIDVTNPANPTFKGSCDTPDQAWEVTLFENYAYVADYDSGLQIINISDITNPTFKASYDIGDNAQAVIISGNYAYVAAWTSGLQIIEPNLDKLSLSGVPNSVGTYSVDIRACNEAKECITDSFDIVVKNFSVDTDVDTIDTNVNSGLIITSVIGSVIGAICIVGVCSLLIVVGIVMRKKFMKNNGDVIEEKSGSSLQKDVDSELSQPFIEQKLDENIEYDLGLDGKKVPTVPDYEENAELKETFNFSEDGTSKIKGNKIADNAEFDEVPSKDLCCPISHELMKDPVIVVESEQTYDRESIESWFKNNDTDPLTGKKVADKKLITNFAIKSQVEEWITNHKK